MAEGTNVMTERDRRQKNDYASKPEKIVEQVYFKLLLPVIGSLALLLLGSLSYIGKNMGANIEKIGNEVQELGKMAAVIDANVISNSNTIQSVKNDLNKDIDGTRRWLKALTDTVNDHLRRSVSVDE